MAKQKPLIERWAEESKEKDGGVRIHDVPEGERKPVKMKGFTEEEMRKILGEEEYEKLKKSQVDEIDEV